MSGVAVIRSLLAADGTLTGTVLATKIMAGILPLDTVAPAIGITQVSGVPRNTMSMNEATGIIAERVQVTVQGATYPQKNQILALVLRACPNQRGTINGVSVVSILPDTVGPDFDDINPERYVKSRDFIVHWREQR